MSYCGFSGTLETLNFQVDCAKRICRNSVVSCPSLPLRVSHGQFLHILWLKGQFYIQNSHNNHQPPVSPHAPRRYIGPNLKLDVSHKLRSCRASRTVAGKEAVEKTQKTGTKGAETALQVIWKPFHENRSKTRKV